MKNIWQIFKRDVLRIRTNVIAMIVIMGVTVVPCLYAWFNIAGSWDPYSNTGNLKVAVASVDDGYEGSLIPIRINIGDQVLSSLRENTQMDWVFTSQENAVSGVQSGEYYAAIVIPKDFSDKMMSIFRMTFKSQTLFIIPMPRKTPSRRRSQTKALLRFRNKSIRPLSKRFPALR